ncbi:hypothetical protein BPAE_0449g00050 [Botrytis paeoniae]|uniref:Carboxylesterase type B domain-containing protein n=1 Tax=Botrytis paeoniae TaxID=278948 RepID=A0A4Z1EZZ9_9HELO|nr:hypothetical protein BPAE_0449g00050 [Botrytis paeoniae]
MAMFIILLAISAFFAAATRKSSPVVDLGYSINQATIELKFSRQLAMEDTITFQYSVWRSSCWPTTPIPPRTANRTINTGQEARSYYRAHLHWLKTAQQYINKVPLDEIKPEWFDINNPPLHDASQSEDCLFLDVMVPTTVFDRTSKIETFDDEPSAPF